MLWIVAIIMGILLYEIGALSVLVAVMALTLKAILFVFMVLAVLIVWRWIKHRRSQL
jgi:hypothetical protein